MARIPVAAIRFTPHTQIVRIRTIAGGCYALALVAGIILAPLFDILGLGFRLEVFTTVFIILPTVCIYILVSRRRIPWRNAALPMILEIATAWVGHGLGWVTLPTNWPRFFAITQVMTNGMLISIATALVLLWLIQLRWTPTDGPYCQQCDYMLIGVSGERCPECGKSFDPAHIARFDAVDFKAK